MIRIKNQKVNEEKYKKIESNVYDEIVNWYTININEQTKSKIRIIQSKLLDFFAKVNHPTTMQIKALLTLLNRKYLTEYPDITLHYKATNSLENDNVVYFIIYVNFNNIYTRNLIENNKFPEIDGKKIILNIEIEKDELSEIIKDRTIKIGNFEEI